MKNIKQSILITLLVGQISLSSIAAKAEGSNQSDVVVDTIEVKVGSDVDIPNSVKNQKKSFFQKTLDLYFQGQEYLKTASKYVDIDLKKLKIKWGSINSELEKAIEQAIKDGNKDPIKTGKKVNDAVSEQENTDLINTSPEVQGEQAQKDVHQTYSRSQSQAILGEKGQKNQAEEAEIANTAVSDTLEQANAAQNDVVTQDILKKMAVQNLQTAMLTKSVHQETQKQTQLLATTNMNLADISEQMSVEERKKQAESSATSREILRAGSALDSFWKN